MTQLKVEKDEVTIEGEDSLIGKFMAGAQKGITINTPLGRREIHKVKNSQGKVLKDDLHPENVGKIERRSNGRGSTQ